MTSSVAAQTVADLAAVSGVVGDGRRRGAKKVAEAEVKVPGPSPLVKWAGGKTKLLPDLVLRSPRGFRRYYEPFCGGAALFFRLCGQIAGSAPGAGASSVLGDVNDDLIRTYRSVAAGAEYVVRELEGYSRWYLGQDDRRGAFYRMRDMWNADRVNRDLSDTSRAAMMLFLNRTCYNGLWRVNKGGGYNVPYGKYKNPKICFAPEIRAAAAAWRGTRFESGDYAATVADAEVGDFVYFDSPYDGTFDAYAAGKFDAGEQARLAEVARNLVQRGCGVMLSNSDTPLVRELYGAGCWTLHEVTGARSISCDGASRDDVRELIITGGYSVG